MCFCYSFIPVDKNTPKSFSSYVISVFSIIFIESIQTRKFIFSLTEPIYYHPKGLVGQFIQGCNHSIWGMKV